MNSILPFELLESFSDPQLNDEGLPYGPTKYKELTRERYIISKHSNTSYSEIGDISPLERSYLLEFIADELKKQKELIDKQKEKLKSSKHR